MITTTEAAALLNALMAERGELRHYTNKHLARLCQSGKVAGQKLGRDWLTTEEAVRVFAATPKAKGGRPRKDKSSDHDA